MTMRQLLPVMIILATLPQACCGQPVEANHQEFIELAEALDFRMQKRLASLELLSLVSKEKALQSYETNGLAPSELAALLRYEERHRTTHVGLMALRKIILLGGKSSFPAPDVYKSRTAALRRLHHYASLPILSETISHLAESGFVMSGYVDRNTGECLRAIIQAPDVNPNVTAAAKLKLCDWILSFETFVQHQKKIILRLKELKGKDDIESAINAKEIEFFLPVLPTDGEYRKWKFEANQLLGALVAEEAPSRMPVVRPHGHPDIVRIDLKATQKLPTIASLAQKRKRHRVGSVPEELQVELLDGTLWKLSSLNGKIVIIQFSFTGCAPCKLMYPVLEELTNKFPGSLRALTIMKDEDLNTTKKSVVDNSISWSVVCDSDPGGITDRWGIESFPTVIIIDRDGKIASLNANDNNELQKIVSALASE